MATEESKNKQSEEEKPKPKVGIADYLQAPRKKRRSFVVAALSKNVKPELPMSIDGYLRSGFPHLTCVYPRTPEDLIRHFARQIVLLVFDDEFCNLETGMKLVRELKQKKTQNVIPVLFLTRNSEKLVRAYNRLLLPWHETDEYINHTKAPINHLLSKIKAGLVQKNRRRSRRYKVDIAVKYFSLVQDKLLDGRLLDLSVHGALLQTDDKNLFRDHEQLKIHLPIAEHISPSEDGDFLRLAARVRRVRVGGNQVGVSFEYMSEKQIFILTRYVTEMVSKQLVQRNLAAKLRTVRAQQKDS